MSIVYGGAVGTKAASGASSTNFTAAGNVPAGALLVAGAGLYKNGTVTGVTFSGGPSTWQTDKFVTPYSGDANYTVAIGSAYDAVGHTTPTLTLTLNGGGTAFAITYAVVYFTGSDTTTWLDAVNNGAGVNGSQHWTSSLTATAADAVVVGYGWIDLSAGSNTPDSGWTEDADFQNTIDSNTAALVHQIISSTGTYSPGGTFAGGGPYVTVAASYVAASGGGGGGSPIQVFIPTRMPLGV